MRKIINKKGITLISLIVTIIVMLILAGITINLTLGQDGILRKAEEAGENYTNAADYERDQLEELTNTADDIIANVIEGNNTPINPVLGTIIKTEDDINYTADGDGNVIPVPVGFSPITTQDQGTKYSGFVIKDTTTNEDGTPTVTNGNEFVWIPVDSTTSYKYERVAFAREGWSDSQTLDTTNGHIKKGTASNYFSELIPTIGDRTELESVTEYGGYYIGRYEAGIALTTERNSNSGTEDILLVQKGKNIYNYISCSDAKIKSEGLYTKSNNNVISRLCSSYAWDTALKFIETQNSEYTTNSVGGYYDQTAPTTTGYDTVHPCNIYDLGGNAYEWTTENYSNKDYPCTVRGGIFSSSTDERPAVYRSNAEDEFYNKGYSFRVTLFL